MTTAGTAYVIRIAAAKCRKRVNFACAGQKLETSKYFGAQWQVFLH